MEQYPLFSHKVSRVLVDATRHFPTADNSQAIKFDLLEDGCILKADMSHVGGFSDQQGFLTYIALGTAIRTFQQQADFMQLKIAVKLIEPNSDYPYGAFDIRYHDLDSFNLREEIDPFILSRRTEREMKLAPIDEFDEDTLKQSVKPFDCALTLFPNTDKVSKNEIVSIATQAEELRFQSKDIHAELVSAVDHDDKYKGRQFLSYPVLKLAPDATLVFKMIRNWSVLDGLNKALRFFWMLGREGVKKPLSKASLIAVLSAEDYSFHSLVNAGRAIQHFWLDVTELGWCVQPYAAIGTMSSGHFSFAGKLEDKRKRVMSGAKYLLGSQAPIILFRLSKPTKELKVVKSGRRDVDSFITDYHLSK